MMALMTPRHQVGAEPLVWRTNRTPSLISEASSSRACAWCSASVHQEQRAGRDEKRAQSTPIAQDVLAAAMTPPTAGPIMLPIRLFESGRTAFMAAADPPARSGRERGDTGHEERVERPEQDGKNEQVEVRQMMVAMRTTRTAVKSARTPSEMSRSIRRENGRR